jgi:DNA (cytosine-5)-methyltransferase 1
VLTPFLAGNDGSAYQAKPRPLEKPDDTILKESRACIVAPVIARQFGNSVGHRADESSAMVTAVGNKFATVSAFLAKHYGGNYQGAGVGMDEPMHSVTTVDHHAAVTSHLVMLRGTCRDGRVIDAPAPGLTAGGTHVGEVKTTLAVEDYDEERARQVLEFLREYCGEESDGLVTVDGVLYRIVDIGMRMLQPHELYRAQGFPDWYIIDRDFHGVKYAKDKQVARCGNAVPPPFAEALVRANLPELCVWKEAA